MLAAWWTWSPHSKRDALDLMRVHRAWFARLRLVATAIRAVRLACRSPPRVARPAIPPLPAGQVATCAAALPPVPA